ncbi:hypothetical protein [Streptomyces gobiensis]|nr:hypothetical protein [Streptomyces gobiensis]UGY90599.1 hypothetical protein test1122_01900 [Streptomyces gobiensis]
MPCFFGWGSGGYPPGWCSIERRLREEFDFTGTPIHISVRVREKRGKKK